MINKYNNITMHEEEIITEEEIIRSIKSVPNWKTPRHDMIQRYFIKYIEIIKEDIIKLIKMKNITFNN